MQISSTRGITDQVHPGSHYHSQVTTTTTFQVPPAGSSFRKQVVPRVPNFINPVDDEVLATLTASSQERGLVQVFQAPGCSINTLTIVGKVEAGQEAVVDGFEGYTTTTELQNSWVSNNISRLTPRLSLDDPIEGYNCMHLDASHHVQSHNTTVTRTFTTPQDLSSGDGITFHISASSTPATLRLTLRDVNSNEAFYDITIVDRFTWVDTLLPFAHFINGGLLNVEAITQMRLTVVDLSGVTTFRLDDFHLHGAVESVTAKVRLYRLGTSPALPNLNTLTPLPINEWGEDYSVIPLEPNKRAMTLPIHAQDTTTGHTHGDYYALLIEPPADGKVLLYGSTQQHPEMQPLYYVDGDGQLVDTQSSLGFGVFSCGTPSQLRELTIEADNDPACSEVLLFIQDYITGETDYLGNYLFCNTNKIELSFETLPQLRELGVTRRLFIYFNTAMSSSTKNIVVKTTIFYGQG